MSKDYYKILEIDRKATESDIKKAYRKLSSKYHPDKHSDKTPEDLKIMEEKFKEVKHAYEVLSDKQKRANYDRFGTDNPQQQGFSGFGNSIFEEMMRRNSQPQTPRGNDRQQTISITLKESYLGLKKEIKFKQVQECKTCNGTGAKSNSDLILCKNCDGSGVVTSSHGYMMFKQTCPQCHGNGQTIKHKCGSCHGQRYIEVEKTVNITIPKFSYPGGNPIRLQGQGDQILNGTSGDLYLFISELKDDVYTLQQDGSIYCEIPISYKDACLGNKVEITYLDDSKIEINIPKLVKPNKYTGTIRGKGFLGRDFKYKFYINTPEKLSEEEIERIGSL